MDTDIARLLANPYIAIAVCAVVAAVAIFIMYRRMYRGQKKPNIKQTEQTNRTPPESTGNELSDFILSILNDGKTHLATDLSVMAEAKGIVIKSKSYKVAVNRCLFGMKGKGMVGFVEKGLWRIAPASNYVVKSEAEGISEAVPLKEWCLVVDCKTRSRDLEEILVTDLEKAKAANPNGLGRQWYYERYEVYYLFRNKEGLLLPVNMPQTLNNPPPKLYRALGQEPNDLIYDVREKKNVLATYGYYIAVLLVAAFVMIGTMQQGG